MEEEIQLEDYYHAIKKNWLLILAIFLIISGGAVYFSVNMDKVYEAKSLVVMPNHDRISILLGRTTPKNDINTEIEIIKSNSILGKVWGEIGTDFKIKINPVGKSSVIEIIAESNSPEVARDAANGLAEAYVTYTLDASKQDAVDINNFIADEVDSYKNNLDALKLQLVELETNSNNQSAKSQYYAENIKKDIEAKEKLYSYMLSRKEEINIVASANKANREIIEYAVLPVLPSKPNIPINIAIGIILGLMCGFAFAIMKELARNTFKNLKDIESEVGDVLGTIPHANKISKGMHFSDSNNPGFFTRMFCMLKPTIFFIRNNHSFHQHSSPHSLFAENIRMLRTNLMFYAKDHNTKMISITSPQNKDGKSTIAANLSMSLAKNNINVLLVDANMRNPTLWKYFKKIMVNKKGLMDVILNEITLNQAIRKTGQKCLDVLLTGKDNAFPGEIINSKRMKEVFRKIKNMNYDLVIFDSPSLEYSESAFLCSNTQGTLMVIANDITKKEMVLKGKHALNKVKSNIIGVVVNFAE